MATVMSAAPHRGSEQDHGRTPSSQEPLCASGDAVKPAPRFLRGAVLHHAQNFALMLKNTCRGAPAISVWFQPCGSEAT